MERTILHCDCNGFYASVECVFHPELRKVPMAVCGDPESRKGIILAKNELAKQFNVTTTETVWQAKKKCPDLVLVRPHHDAYQVFSKKMNAIYARYTEQVEPFGIDESWLDVTGSRMLFGSGKKIADELRDTVKRELGLTISVGVSFNKVFAKLGSDYKKPDATTIVSRQNYKSLVWPLPVEALLYVGKASQEVFRKLGIRTIGDLAATSEEVLTAKLGKIGAQLHTYANGEDHSPVASVYEKQEAKSVGNGMTFKRNLLGMEDIRPGVLYLADSVAARLRRYGYQCRTVSVAVKDPQFHTVQKQTTLDSPTDLTKDIYDISMALLLSFWDVQKPIRAITVTASHFGEGEGGRQLSLFEQEENGAQHERQKSLEQAVDGIRGKYGHGSISYAQILKNDLGIAPDHHRNQEEK
ncbi:DNA polymerase IV [Fumia xinanensis]|uniref:DNA polymerase IV n=1 Tax=Fumia xinanensis TaxID=2763659 RepID=A0A926E2X0_9FIRM|nr:DNA polymerase IV [Fumia xinanensis]MBC8558743.1 DNA polymerase IV [Fumia xinanensis]